MWLFGRWTQFQRKRIHIYKTRAEKNFSRINPIQYAIREIYSIIQRLMASYSIFFREKATFFFHLSNKRNLMKSFLKSIGCKKYFAKKRRVSSARYASFFCLIYLHSPKESTSTWRIHSLTLNKWKTWIDNHVHLVFPLNRRNCSTFIPV